LEFAGFGIEYDPHRFAIRGLGPPAFLGARTLVSAEPRHADAATGSNHLGQCPQVVLVLDAQSYTVFDAFDLLHPSCLDLN
jgi:hypothetical protein